MKFKITLISIILFATNSFASNSKIGQCNLNDPYVIKKLQGHRELIKELFYVNDKLSAVPVLLANAKEKTQIKNLNKFTAELNSQQKDLAKQLNSLTEKQKWCLLKDLYNSIERATYPRDAHQTFVTAKELFQEELGSSTDAQVFLNDLHTKATMKKTVTMKRAEEASNKYFFNSFKSSGIEGTN